MVTRKFVYPGSTSRHAAIKCSTLKILMTYDLLLGMKSARIYSGLITTTRSLEFESGAELYDESWMEYTKKDCVTDASDPSYSTSFSPYKKTEEPFLQMITPQIEANHVI